jgi:Brp/Blh family beta-carotene 15,15'-monooxygenase
MKGKTNDKKTLINKTLKYFSIVVLICLVFFNLPVISLLFFLLFSAYHFGEQQWTIFENNNSSSLTLFYFFFGSLIFTILFTINSAEVSDVIYDITNFYIPQNAYGLSLIILSLVNVIFMFINYRILKAQLFHQFILFIVMLIVFSFFELLPAFAVYFVFYHSIPSIIEQAEYLFDDSSTKSFKKFIIKGFAYWLIAILFLVFLYMIVKDKIDFSLGIFFSFLAAITFPHVLVIYKMKEITRKK